MCKIGDVGVAFRWEEIDDLALAGWEYEEGDERVHCDDDEARLIDEEAEDVIESYIYHVRTTNMYVKQVSRLFEWEIEMEGEDERVMKSAC